MGRVPRSSLVIVAVGTLVLAGTARGVCTGVTGLVEPGDGTFEGSVSWNGMPGSVVPPEYGAFAQQMPVDGRIDSVIVRLKDGPDAGLSPSVTFDFYVWEDDNGSPGALVNSVAGMVVVPPPPGGDVWTISVAMQTGDLVTPWCGVRIHPGSPGANPVLLASDLDGFADSTPKTNIAPGVGFPTGWQDVSLVFGPVASLGIDAAMCGITPTGTSFETAGGGSNLAIVRNGVWDFESTDLDNFDIDPCSYSLPDTFGSTPTLQGWIPAPESDPVQGLASASLLSADPDYPREVDVEGQALWFFDPITQGFPPGHRGLFESPVIDRTSLGFDPGTLAILFHAATDPLAPPAVTGLRWIVGSRVLLPNSTWSSWRDLRCPVSVGAQSLYVPLLRRGSITQTRVGIENPSGILIGHKASATDKTKVTKPKPVITGPGPGYKPVPQFKQDTGHICMTMAAASCLAYWAEHYPEIYTTTGTLREKNKALADSLAKRMQKKYKNAAGQEKDGDGRGMDGVEEFLKARKIHDPDIPANAPPRRSLKYEDFTGTGATWDVMKSNLARSHDVILGLNGYKITPQGDTVLVTRPNPPGPPEPPGHAVTVAEIVEDGDKKVIKVANSWGDTKDTVDPKDKDKVYDTLEAEVDATTGQVRVRNAKLQKALDNADFLCVGEINIVRPTPPNADPPPPGGPAIIGYDWRALAMAGLDTLVSYPYSVTASNGRAIDYFALEIEVPYYEVESPPGWFWEPLPSLPPGATGCAMAFGPKGIAWRTTTNAVPAGGTLTGFQFKAHERYVPDTYAVDWMTKDTGFYGEFGFIAGPSKATSTSGVPQTPPRPEVFGVSVFPNPSRVGVSISFQSNQASSGRVAILDVAGRHVRDLPLPVVRPGVNAIQWDRRDTMGRIAGSGVYFLLIETKAALGRGRLVLID